MIALIGRAARNLSGVEYCNFVLAAALKQNRTEHEWISFAASTADRRGAASWATFGAALGGLVRLIKICALHRHVIVYMQPSQGGLPLARDVLIAVVVRAVPGSRLAIHLHGEFRAELARSRVGVLMRRAGFATLAHLAHGIVSCISGHVFAGRVTTYVPNTALLGNLASEASETVVALHSVRASVQGRAGYIGLITPGKDVDGLVDATAGHGELRLVGHLPKVLDALSGDADLEEFERHLRAPHVAMVGPLYGADKWAELGTWAVACFPSRSEGLPVAVLEARALGVSVVAYAVGDLPNLASVDPGTTVVPVGDREAFAAAVREALARHEASPVPESLMDQAGFAERVLSALYGIRCGGETRCGAEF